MAQTIEEAQQGAVFLIFPILALLIGQFTGIILISAGLLWGLSATMMKAVEDHAPILITRQNGEACVLMSLEEYNSLEETAYLLRSPANARRLMDSIDSLKSGKGTEQDIIE